LVLPGKDTDAATVRARGSEFAPRLTRCDRGAGIRVNREANADWFRARGAVAQAANAAF
jgi:hypothetical protein